MHIHAIKCIYKYNILFNNLFDYNVQMKLTAFFYHPPTHIFCCTSGKFLPIGLPESSHVIAPLRP